MDIIKIVLESIKRNKILLVILFVFSFVGALIHYFLQPNKYQSVLIVSDASYQTDFIKQIISFENLKGNTFDLPEDTFNLYKHLLEELTVSTEFNYGKTFIKINFLSDTDLTQNKIEYQTAVVDLFNTNKDFLYLKNNLRLNKEIQLTEIDQSLKTYHDVLDSLDINKSSKKYVRIEKRMHKLSADKYIIKNELDHIGVFEILSPISDFEHKKRPLFLFLFLYFVLAGVLYLLISKKP